MELGVMVGALVDGLGLSAWIFVVTLVGSLPLGIVVALCRMSSFKRYRCLPSSTFPFCVALR